MKPEIWFLGDAEAKQTTTGLVKKWLVRYFTALIKGADIVLWKSEHKGFQYLMFKSTEAAHRVKCFGCFWKLNCYVRLFGSNTFIYLNYMLFWLTDIGRFYCFYYLDKEYLDELLDILFL